MVKKLKLFRTLKVEESVNRNLQPLEGATSVVWKFFGFDADKDGRIFVTEKRKRTTVL